MAFADASFEAEYFDHAKYLPFPPVEMRLGLVAGQQIQVTTHTHTKTKQNKTKQSQGT
jgi:hypothetical protein